MQWAQALAFLIGPAGIALGWGLSERSERERAKRSCALERDTQMRARVSGLLVVGRQLLREARFLVRVAELKSSSEPGWGDGRDWAEQFNRSSELLLTVLVEVDLYGPSWLASAASAIDEAANEIVEALHQADAIEMRTASAINAITAGRLSALDAALGAALIEIKSQRAPSQ